MKKESVHTAKTKSAKAEKSHKLVLDAIDNNKAVQEVLARLAKK